MYGKDRFSNIGAIVKIVKKWFSAPADVIRGDTLLHKQICIFGTLENCLLWQAITQPKINIFWCGFFCLVRIDKLFNTSPNKRKIFSGCEFPFKESMKNWLWVYTVCPRKKYPVKYLLLTIVVAELWFMRFYIIHKQKNMIW